MEGIEWIENIGWIEFKEGIEGIKRLERMEGIEWIENIGWIEWIEGIEEDSEDRKCNA